MAAVFEIERNALARMHTADLFRVFWLGCGLVRAEPPHQLWRGGGS